MDEELTKLFAGILKKYGYSVDKVFVENNKIFVRCEQDTDKPKKPEEPEIEIPTPEESDPELDKIAEEVEDTLEDIKTSE